MQNQEDDLLRNLFKESTTRSEERLTEKVMQRIDQSSEVFQYKPIISKRIWLWMSGGVLVLLLISYFSSSSWTFREAPDFLPLLGQAFDKVTHSFSFDPSKISLPVLSPVALVSISALNIIGVFLIVTYRWGNWMFKR